MKPSIRVSVIGAIVATVAVAAWFALGAGSSRDSAPAVDYTLLDGTRGNISRLKGQVVLVNFWATSCTTCVKEMPQIVDTYQRYRNRGFQTLAVAMEYDPPAYVASFARTRALPFGVAIDNTGEIARQFGQVRVTPTTVLINKRGEVVKRYVGEPDFPALHALVEQLLSES
ncbi:MAG: TlpA family protein disulfide reductase [Burkholderiaceae bacterium]|nr:TlpA family protein disulfide reductase [Aquabacterium sp.]NUP85268.1 TlpA family protein disulfide reductase [Burkholderiaceae bacterium]